MAIDNSVYSNVVPSFLFVSLLLESFVPLVNHVNSTLKMIPLMFFEKFLLDNGLGPGKNLVNFLLRLVSFRLFSLQNPTNSTIKDAGTKRCRNVIVM